MGAADFVGDGLKQAMEWLLLSSLRLVDLGNSAAGLGRPSCVAFQLFMCWNAVLMNVWWRNAR